MNSISRKPWVLIVMTMVMTLAVAGGAWWVLTGSKPTNEHTYFFVGTISPTQQDDILTTGIACITPEKGALTGAAAGKDWCGPVYPSAGLNLAQLTPNLRVGVLAFNSTVTPAADGYPLDVRGALVLPVSAAIPGVTAVHGAAASQADTEAFAPHLVGLTEADATTAATSLGFTVRVASVDGKGNMLTTDFRGNRIELTIVNGLVTKTEVG